MHDQARRATAFPIPDDSRMAGVHRSTTPRPRPRLAFVTAVLALAALLGGCSEDLETSVGCATLCPGTDVKSIELTLDAIAEERVVPGIVETGAETLLPLIDRKDTVQTRAVLRFDTLLTKYSLRNTDSLLPIDSVIKARILLSLDRGRSTVQDTVYLEAYDIDDGTDDTTAAGIESRIVPGRLIGSRTLVRADVLDTVSIPLDNSAVKAKIQKATDPERRLRVALRARSPRSLVLRVVATQGGATRGPLLLYEQQGDSVQFSMIAESDVPADPHVAGLLADFTTVPVRPPVRSDAVFAVGGIPPRRTFLRFAIPDSIDEAAAVLQAELRLVQVPDPLRVLLDTVTVDTTSSGRRERADTVVVLPLIGIGNTTVIGDPVRAAQLARRTIGLDQLFVPALRVSPADSGTRTINLAGLLRRWRFQAEGEPRYIVLSAESEGAQAASAYFWSSAAADPTLRPRLYIRYVPRVGYGLP